MARGFNPLTNLLKNKNDIDKFVNQYDDGSLWSKQDEIVEPKNYAVLDITNDNISGFNPLSSFGTSQTATEDPLQAPRNQMQYYTNQLGKLGVEVEKPDTNSGGFGKLLEKIFSVPASVGNALSGGVDAVLQNVHDNKNSKEEREKLGEGKLEYAIKDTGRDIANILKGSASSFINTYKSAWGGGSYDDVTDWGKIINNMQERGKDGNIIQKSVADIMEAPGYLATKAVTLGKASNETASNVGNLVADIAMSFGTGKITDLEDVGKSIKYLNKADEVDKASKVANNLDEATRLAKQSMSYDDFVNSYKNTADKMGKNIDGADFEKLYGRHISTSAEKLMKDTNKYIGGINDFDGLKLGDKTIISKEGLKNISSNKLQKGLLEAGLSMYSPIGAVMNSSVTNAISEQAMKLETVQGMVKDVNDKIRFGSNNQYINQARKEFKDGNYDEVLSNVAQKQDSILKKRISEINTMFAVNKADKMQKKHGDEVANTMSKVGEEPETILKRYEDTETNIVNPAYVKKVKDSLESEFNIKGKNIEDLASGNTIPQEKLKALEKEIADIENLPKKTTLNFSEQLKALDIEGNEKYFNQSLSMSLEDLTDTLKNDGIDNAYEVAKRLKTASNNVIDTFKKNNPTLAELSLERKSYKMEEILSGNAFGAKDEKGSYLDKIREVNATEIKPKTVEEKALEKERKNIVSEIKLRKKTLDMPFNNARKELVGMLDDKELKQYHENSVYNNGSYEGRELVGKAKELVNYDKKKVEKLEKIKNDVSDILQEDYDQDTIALFVKNYLEKQGVTVKGMDKKAMSFYIENNEHKGIYDLIEDRFAQPEIDKLSKLDKYETQLYMSKTKELNTPKKPEVKVSTTLEKREFNKQSKGYTDFEDMGDDIKKRETWAGEQQAQVETKEYTGGDSEYKVKTRGEEVNDIIKQKKKDTKYNNREALQNIGNEDLREYMSWKSNMTKNTNPEASEKYRELSESGSRVDIEVAITQESIESNRHYNKDKIISKDKAEKIQSISKNSNTLSKYADVFESLDIDTKDLSKWTNFEQGVFYDTMNFDKNINTMAKKFPVAYNEIMKKTNGLTLVDYSVVKYVTDFVKMPDDYVNIKKNITKTFDSSVLPTQDELAKNIEEAKREFNLPKDKPITSTEVQKMEKEAKLSDVPVEVPVVKQEPIKTEEIKVTKEPVKPITEAPKGDFIGYEADINGKKVIINENTNPEDLSRVIIDYLVSDKTFYTKLDNGNIGLTSKKTNNVFLDVSMDGKSKEFKDNFEIIKTHEDIHVIQNKLQSDGIATEQIKEFMTSLANAPKEKIEDIIKLVKLSAVDNTSEELLRKGVISSYANNVYKNATDNFDKLRETDAVIGSMLLTNNQEVQTLARKVFGEDIFSTYMNNLSKYSDVEFSELKKMNRTSATEELNKKLDTMRNLAVTIDESQIADKQEYLVKLGSIIEEMDLNEQNIDSVDNLLNTLNKYKELNPEAFNKATEGLNEQIKVIKSIEVLDKVDNLSNLTQDQLDDLNFIKDQFMKFGKEEGIIADGEEQLFANYMYHMINPKLANDEKAMKLAKETFGNSIEDIFNNHSRTRKYQGTIEEVNKSFKKTLEKNGIDGIDLFETNIFDIYTKRAINHEKYMLKTSRQDTYVKEFGMKDIKNFQKEVDSVDNLKSRLEYFFDRDGIKEYDMKQIAKDFEESNKTIYQFLRTEYKKYGIKHMFEEDIRDLSGDVLAKNTVRTRFKNNSDINKLDTDYVVYDKGSCSLLGEEAQEIIYKEKLESVERMKAKGLTDKSWKDNREIAKEKGLKYVDNSMVRVEAYEMLNEEARHMNFDFDGGTEAYSTWRKERGQEIRRELRDKYKKDSTVHFAFSDVEVNYQKAYKDMMDDMLHNGEYVYVTKLGKKDFKNYKTVGSDVEIKDFPSEQLSDYSVVDKSSIRNRNIAESNDEYYVFKKDNWDNYQKELKAQTVRDESAFLKAYDKITGLFKAQALASGRFITNSAFGNFFESYVTSGVNLTNPKMIKQFMKFKKGEDININGYNAVDIRNAMEQFGALETESLNEFKKTSDRLKKFTNAKPEELTPLQKLGKKTGAFNPLSTEFGLYKGVQKTQGEIEEMSRFINVATHLSQGKSMAEAISNTQKALFDYSDLTTFEQNTLKRVIPFYTFMRNNMPLQLENMANKTGKLQRVQSVYTKADNKFNNDKDRALRPDYLNNALSIGKNKFLNLPNPVNDLEKLLNPKEMAQSLNPLIKTPIELMLNKQIYSGSDISKYDKPKEKVEYAVNSVAPIFKQYIGAIGKAKEGDYKSLANIMGVPVKTFDTDKAEQQTMYAYVDQLENQYYELLEENPELKEVLEAQKNTKKKTTSSKSFSPLAKLINQ